MDIETNVRILPLGIPEGAASVDGLAPDGTRIEVLFQYHARRLGQHFEPIRSDQNTNLMIRSRLSYGNGDDRGSTHPHKPIDEC